MTRTEVWFIDPAIAPWTKGAGEILLVRWTGKRSYQVERFAGAPGYTFRYRSRGVRCKWRQRKHWKETNARTFVGYL